MKLFRHHSQSFQNKINNSENFISDNSRDFNFDNKNEAGLYFYSTTIQGAECYKIDDDYFGEITQLFEYTACVNLLDLRIAENRLKLPEIIKILVDNENEIKESTISELKKDGFDVNKTIDAKKLISKTTELDVINDTPYSGHTFWGQNIVDYKLGILVKNLVISLGFEGFIINGSSKGDDVVLFKAAKPCK